MGAGQLWSQRLKTRKVSKNTTSIRLCYNNEYMRIVWNGRFVVVSAVEITVAAHDTTGGMVTKISEAALIAKLGIDVYIVKVTFAQVLSYMKFSSSYSACLWALRYLAVHRQEQAIR